MTLSNTTNIAIIDSQRILLDGAAAWISQNNPEINLAIAATRWSEFTSDRLSSGSVHLDVIVLDMDIPGCVPVLAIRTLAMMKAGIIVTGTRPSRESVRAALDSGAAGFICKTDGLSTLTDAVHAVAAGGTYVSSAMQELLNSVTSRAKHPELPAQQIRVLAGYSSGMTMKQTAAVLCISESTGNDYLKKARATCLAAGFDIGTKISARQYALDRGYVAAV